MVNITVEDTRNEAHELVNDDEETPERKSNDSKGKVAMSAPRMEVVASGPHVKVVTVFLMWTWPQVLPRWTLLQVFLM